MVKSNCYNGRDYERLISVENCLCQMNDFQCDFGFKRYLIRLFENFHLFYNVLLWIIGTHLGLMVAFWTKITITNHTNHRPDAHPENFTIWHEDISKSEEIRVKLENLKFLNRKVSHARSKKKRNFCCFRYGIVWCASIFAILLNKKNCHWKTSKMSSHWSMICKMGAFFTETPLTGKSISSASMVPWLKLWFKKPTLWKVIFSFSYFFFIFSIEFFCFF